MSRTVFDLNKKIYRQPRERMAAMTGASTIPAGRRSLVQRDYYTHSRHTGMRRVTMVIVVIACILIVQSIFQVPFLRIRNVTISGLKYIPVEQVKPFIVNELSRRRMVFFKNDNYFLFAKTKLKKRLEEAFFLNVISLEKRFPNALHLDVRGRISPFVIQTGDILTALDTKGVPVGIVSAVQPSQSIIVDERMQHDSIIPITYLEKTTNIKELWEKTIVNVAIQKFNLTDDPQIIVVTVDRGFQVRFDATSDIEKQMNRLSLFLQDTALNEPKDYVDLRFDEKLFSQ